MSEFADFGDFAQLDDDRWDDVADESTGETYRQQAERWAAEDEQRAAAQAAEREAAFANAYADQRLGQITRTELERAELDGNTLHLPAVHDLAGGLLNDPQWQRDHNTLQGEPLQAAAIRDALSALSPAKDEHDHLRRRELRLRAGGG